MWRNRSGRRGPGGSRRPDSGFLAADGRFRLARRFASLPGVEGSPTALVCDPGQVGGRARSLADSAGSERPGDASAAQESRASTAVSTGVTRSATRTRATGSRPGCSCKGHAKNFRRGPSILGRPIRNCGEGREVPASVKERQHDALPLVRPQRRRRPERAGQPEPVTPGQMQQMMEQVYALKRR